MRPVRRARSRGAYEPTSASMSRPVAAMSPRLQRAARLLPAVAVAVLLAWLVGYPLLMTLAEALGLGADRRRDRHHRHRPHRLHPRPLRRLRPPRRRVAGALADAVDLRRLGGAGGADRRAAGVHLRAQRVPRPAPARRADRPAGGAAAAGGGDRLPLPLRRERLRLARRPGRPRPRRAALAAGRAGRHPAGPRLLDVRLLLPLHPRRPGPPRRCAAGGRRRARRRPAAHPRAGDPAAPPSGPGRRGAPHLHDRAGVVLGAVHLRRRLPGDDHPDRLLEAQRRPGDGAGGDRRPGGDGADRAVGDAAAQPAVGGHRRGARRRPQAAVAPHPGGAGRRPPPPPGAWRRCCSSPTPLCC